jgi:stage V sporulation protein G
MKITKVQGRKFDRPNSNVKGVVEVTLDDCFVVKDIRIIEKPEKMVVAMPSRVVAGRNEDGTINEEIKVHIDQAHPINKETREMFNETILGAYERATTSEFSEEF